MKKCLLCYGENEDEARACRWCNQEFPPPQLNESGWSIEKPKLVPDASKGEVPNPDRHQSVPVSSIDTRTAERKPAKAPRQEPLLRTPGMDKRPRPISILSVPIDVLLFLVLLPASCSIVQPRDFSVWWKEGSQLRCDCPSKPIDFLRDNIGKDWPKRYSEMVARPVVSTWNRMVSSSFTKNCLLVVFVAILGNGAYDIAKFIIRRI
jgi:hypothetical protein